MNERERILDLVKKGVLSTEEALDLLESMAKDKDEKQINKAAAEVTADKTTDIFEEVEPTTLDTEDFDGEEKLRQNEAQDKENLEKILDSLATDANQASAELDEINVEIAGLKEELKEAQETVMQLNTKEELDQLSDEELASRQEAESTITDLEESLDALTEEKAALDAKLQEGVKTQLDATRDALLKLQASRAAVGMVKEEMMAVERLKGGMEEGDAFEKITRVSHRFEEWDEADLRCRRYIVISPRLPRWSTTSGLCRTE